MQEYKLFNSRNELINTLVLEEHSTWVPPTGHRLEFVGDINNEVSITSFTQLEFLRKFTAEERISIRSSIDPMVIDFLYLLDLAQDISLLDPDTIAGVNYCESIGLLAEGRAAQILS